ncbi:MBL fold metallo-hydrolase [Sphingomonas jatrophae]|uniref:Phosphoribosyl 1,2-cyclic phosphodiesterase n=1 Tax=Sphingomonas jatrophae TaxID=1166337 RepID=A0A1I6LMG6_9SPHN|nr:MBL fold metallo-hydrolase [Sphingomonas jatrophae]SFS04613.1 Phosphoribosyl 1,2-cyclic phosphodiesterase [Sphingomonas jatrophae]
MRVRFWGTRGSLPVGPRADSTADKLARALLAADGLRFADREEALAFVATLPFALGGSYGGATSCVEIEGPEDAFLVCDMGSGLREFGLDAMHRIAAGHAPVFHIFLSHMHWDHIMGFPFFAPAFDPRATIVIHGGHPDMEQALRRQQEEISFPVPFDALRATISFQPMQPGQVHEIAGVFVTLAVQDHSHGSFAYRFEAGGASLCYATDGEHKLADRDGAARFGAFLKDADLVIFDTMYSLAESVTLKADWGHSSNIVAVELCQAAGVRTLAMFHHEPTSDDEAIAAMHRETVRYAAFNAAGHARPLDVICAFDGMEVLLSPEIIEQDRAKSHGSKGEH